MDSHERHELQENDLAEFLANLGEWWEKYGNATLIVVMVVVLAAAGWRYVGFRSAQAHEDAWTDLAFATSPEVYRTIAQSHDNPAVQALAYLHGADLLLGKALTAEIIADGPTAADAGSTTDADTDAPSPADTAPQDPQALLTGAQAMYEKALDIAPHGLYRINAQLGLAAVAETREQWDRAREHYQQAIEAADPTFPMLAQRAGMRIEMLDQLSRPVVFAPETPPEAPEASNPSDTPTDQAAPDAQAAPAPGADNPSEAAGTGADAAAPAPNPDDQ